jgi:cytochrome P450
MMNEEEGLWGSLVGPLYERQLLVTAVVIAIPLFYLFVKKLLNRPKLPYPPGPKGVFFFGNALQLPDPRKGEMPEQRQLEWTKEFGNVYTISIPVVGKMIVICDPELAKQVLVKKNYDKSPLYQLFTPVIGKKSIVILHGKEWSTKRRAFNPGFGPAFLKTMVTTMAEKMERFVECIEFDINMNEPTNMLTRAQTFTSDAIVSIAFGEDWGGKEPHPARLWESEICRLSAGLVLDPMLLLFGYGTRRKIRVYEKLLDQEMLDIVERRLANHSSDSKNTDICSIAIDQMRQESGTLTDDDKIAISHQLKTFYFAGHDTTASTIAWAMWCVSQHATVLEKVREELKEHSVWEMQTTPDYDQLQKCTYLEAVVKETLRLYPPLSSYSRYESNLDETYKGYTIGGAILGVNAYAIHRHPDLWKEPLLFRPERFLDGSEGDISSKFFAFSRGPRDCLGKYFAMVESKLAISALVKRYNLECVDPNEKLIVQVTTLPMNGAQIKFTPRSE